MSIYLGEQLIAGLAASERITLQLGDTQVVTFPFKPAIDGIISISTTQEAGTSVYITFSDSTTGTGVGSLNGVMQTQTSGVGTTGYMSNMFVVRAGANVTVYNPKNLSFNATFTPFIPTTGEPVKQTYDPTSDKPISGAGVQQALSHIGMIVQSTTLDTEAKVKAIYGGVHWEKIVGKFLQGVDSNAGQNIAAGLPNITGTLYLSRIGTSTQNGTLSNGALSVNNDGATGLAECDSQSQFKMKSNLSFNASNSNSIYGNSTTVQPPAFTVYIWHRTA